MMPDTISAMPGKTLFMTAANRDAVLVTRTGNQMRRRALNFADEHAALNWCLDRQATFVLLPKKSNHAQN